MLCEGNRQLIYKFIQRHAAEFVIRWLLRRFQLSPTAYYGYVKQRKKEALERKQEVLRCIHDLYHHYSGKPGYRMMKRYLEKKGHFYSLLTVHKYMNELGLRSIVYKKKPEYIKGKAHQVFPNLLNRDFTAEHKNEKWCTDFTYIHLSNGSLRYNCSILDLKDRSIVATKTAAYITADLAIETLQEAICKHRPKKGFIS
ncbi:IS3 family transposase [Longirhabdus pacifica]|uniref:IS3 family transposase n=1 Tax=Longirhabdus pacifica TaxID=2305227 RepID=UPI001F0CBF4D|nr:IS3 family transposase [Longirhabdus pacifica]